MTLELSTTIPGWLLVTVCVFAIIASAIVAYFTGRNYHPLAKAKAWYRWIVTGFASGAFSALLSMFAWASQRYSSDFSFDWLFHITFKSTEEMLWKVIVGCAGVVLVALVGTIGATPRQDPDERTLTL